MTFMNGGVLPVTLSWPTKANNYNPQGVPKANAVFDAIVVVPPSSRLTFDESAGASGPYIQSLCVAAGLTPLAG